MDHRTIQTYVGICVYVIGALVLASPVRAEEAPDSSVYEMPMPIPALPETIDALTVDDFPDLAGQMPQITYPNDGMALIDAAEAASDSVLSNVEDTLDSTLSSLSGRLDNTRTMITEIRLRVGAPTSAVLIKPRDGGGNYTSYTAYETAQEMRGSIYVSVAYLKGLSGLGGVGLDLTFIVLALGWVAAVNIIDFVLHLNVSLIRIIGGLIGVLHALVDLLIQVINAIANIINLIKFL